MPEVIPFKCVYYNPEKIMDVSSVVAPPYDIISPSMQEQIYSRSPHNVVRITLGKIHPEDNEKNNRYTRASGFLSDWLKQGILIQDKNSAVYVYEQEFRFRDENKRLTGFIALCKLEDFKKRNIRPHEKTFSAIIKDRFMLMQECMANPEPILCLYSNSEITKLISSAKKEGLFDFNEDTHKRHRLLRIEDNNTLSKISEEMRKDVIYIADGHHRYQTALQFSKEMHSKSEDNKTMPYDYIMMLLADMNDDSLLIFPTHRVIPKINIGLNDFLNRSNNLFRLKEIEGNNLNSLLLELEKNKEVHAIGLFAENSYYLLMPKNERLIIEEGNKRYGKSKPIEWHLLDVSILENLIIKSALGMESYGDKDILYTRDANEAISLAGKNGFAFLLNPTDVQDVKSIANLNETMPHKSTYFFPKQLSGLVMYKF